MALSANRTVDIRNVLGQKEGSLLIHTAAVVYKHALIVAHDDGLACLPAANSATTNFLGLAKTGPLTGDGTETCTYVYDIEAKLPSENVTAGNLGATLHCKDDQTVCLTTTLGPVAGVMAQYDATNSVWVWLRGSTHAEAS
jgi:hypothetical protein